MVTIGQTLWWVGMQNYCKGECEVTVAKVGRKWITLSNSYRVDRETMWADGGKYVAPGRCFENEAAWRSEQECRDVWRRFAESIRNRWDAPAGIDVDRIRRAAMALGFEV